VATKKSDKKSDNGTVRKAAISAARAAVREAQRAEKAAKAASAAALAAANATEQVVSPPAQVDDIRRGEPFSAGIVSVSNFAIVQNEVVFQLPGGETVSLQSLADRGGLLSLVLWPGADDNSQLREDLLQKLTDLFLFLEANRQFVGVVGTCAECGPPSTE
jgi:hypothetical protein